MKHDGFIQLATGKTREDKHWKNGKVVWSELIERLRNTHRTHETVSEYAAASKARQAEIKDIGGFVAGHIVGGRRKKDSITSRSALTLDLDFAQPDFWDTFTCLYSCAACVYSTHKHTPESPRLRLVIPLDRDVMPDEYQAIARQVAGTLGINDFDDTTFQPSRLMYWPSTSRDGVYQFEVQDGQWLVADDVLAEYTDWRDSASWPISDRVKEAVHRGAEKQGDPLEKPGVIGTFCREYGIKEILETVLADRYEAVANSEDRYTYMHGSTAAGLVVYEDKFAFSHHGTDPISGKLVNAFDLVRLHLYGDNDDHAREGTSPSKLPSFIAMEEFALADKRVRRRMAVERLEDVKEKFSGMGWEDVEAEEGDPFNPESPSDYNDDWLGELDQTKKGETNATIDNALLILRNDPALKGVFALNKFDLREVALRHMPWRRINKRTQCLKDSDDVGLRHYMETKYNLKSKQCIQDALVLIVEENSFHPILDYFATLKWDGESRIEDLLTDFLGAPNTTYVRTVMRKFCVAAVARIFDPGCKYDNVLTLVGAQGTGKSTFFQRLGRGWHSDSFGNIQSKEAYESLQGTWIMEIGELAGLKKAEAEAVKLFISKLEDRYRVAYGRRTETFARQCVFAGTTNNKEFLDDPTGNRRWWPVEVGLQPNSLDIWDDLTPEYVNQIWAEAVHLYKGGEPLHLDKEISEQAVRVQREYSVVDSRREMVQTYLDRGLAEGWETMDLWSRREWLRGEEPAAESRNRVTVAELWEECFGSNLKDLDIYKAKEVKRIMSAFTDWDWGVIRVGGKGKSQRGYSRIGAKRGYKTGK